MVDRYCVVGAVNDAKVWGESVDYAVYTGGDAEGEHACVKVWNERLGDGV